MIKLVHKFQDEITFLLEGFGYSNINDFMQSTFHVSVIKPITFLSTTLAVVAMSFETVVGLQPIVYLAFTLLIIFEVITGIKASIKEGKKIESRKFGRMIIKLSVYTILIAIVNTFKQHLVVPRIFGVDVNIYEWIYFAVLNMIIIQLLISLLENLGRLGYGESSLIIKFLKKLLNKYISIDTVPKTEGPSNQSQSTPTTQTNEQEIVNPEPSIMDDSNPSGT